MVPYFPIADEVLTQIVQLKLERIRQRIADSHGAQVQFPEQLAARLAARCLDVESGARNADAILTRTLLSQLSGGLLARMASGKPVKKIAVSLKGEAVKVRVS